MTVIVALALLALFASVSEAGKKLPDLKPAEAGFDGKPFAFIGKPLRVSVEDTTANAGKARAGPTLTRVFLKHGGDRRRVDERAVGALRPRERDRGKTHSKGPNEFPAGAYRVIVCADAKDQVKESNERNNCGRVTSPAWFYSTYEQWEGRINGTAPGLFGVLQTWKPSPNASFGFDGYLGGGLFSWKVDGGGVTYTTEGSSAGCSYSGSGTFALDRNFGQLLLNYNSDTYTANAAVSVGATYTVVETCPGGPRNWTAYPPLLALQAIQQKLPFGATVLKGALADPALKDVLYTWNLAGG